MTTRGQGILCYRHRSLAAVLLFAPMLACSHEVTHDGKPMEYWVSQVASSDSAIRHQAIEAFAHDAGRSPEAAQALLSVLATEREADVHAAIADALGLLGPNALAAAPALVRLLGDEHEIVRIRAAAALGGIGATSPLVVPALIRALRDGSHDVRATAAAALGQVGPPAADAVPELVRLTRDDHIGFVWLQSTKALGLIHARPEIVLPALTSELDSDWSALREEALIAIARFGPQAASTAPVVRRAMRDSTLEVRVSAARTLAAISATRP